MSGYCVAANKIPGSFITSTKLEAQALMKQGMTRSEAFSQIRRFNAGNADGFSFHFAPASNAKGIIGDGIINPSKLGVRGPGVYSGTTPTPSSFLKNTPFIGWGLGGKGANVRIPFKSNVPSKTYSIPPKTRVFDGPVTLGGGG